MPGRQSTGPRPLLKSRPPQRRKRKRGLDAFAIADEEAQRSAKVRQSRLGRIEGGGSPDPDLSQDDDDDDEDNPRQAKRPRGGDEANGLEGSDSEGNRWMTGGHIPSDDDSSLDSDEAMGSSDEERFEGFTFRGSSSNKAHEKRHRKNVDADSDVDLNEEESDEQSEAESEGYDNDAIDPAAVLDQRDSESDVPDSDVDGAPYSQPPISLQLPEIDQEEDDVSWLSFSEEDEDTQGLSGLQSFVGTLNKSANGRSSGRSAAEFHEGMVPTDFGITSKKKLSINDMLETVTDPKARKSLRSLTTEAKPSGRTNRIPQKLAVPLPKRQQDRLDRSVAYDASKDTLERWVETVKHNRRAEHLEFPLADPAAASAKNNAHLSSEPSIKPITALESTIQRIMEESGIDVSQGKSQDDQIQEFEELKANEMPIEEVRARRAQLRKARELLFREEIKAKRIKKIKSKSWRKVHRKERERNAVRERELLAEEGIEPDEDEVERAHRQRAEERMGGRHRASRWAKGVKKSGRAAWDDEARAGIHEMARREEELKKRMQGQDVDASSATQSGSESDDELSSDEENEWSGSRQLLKKLDEMQRPSETSGGLHSLKFMQKAEAARKARNDEDIERLRRELAGEESPLEDSSDETPLGRRKFGPIANTEANDETSNDRNEFEVREDMEGQEVEFTGRKEASGQNRVSSSKKTKANRASTTQTPKESASKQPKDNVQEQTNENPWMTVKKKSRSSRQAATAGADVKISTAAELPVIVRTGNKPQSKQSQKSSEKPAADAVAIRQESDSTSDSGSDSDSDSEPTTPALSNQALIRQAFAGDDVLAAADFAAEKAALEAAEAAESADEVEQQLPGWGNWVGEGVSNASKKRAQRHHTAITTTSSAVANGASNKSKKKPTTDQRVIISGKTQKPNANYLATQLPHPFETKAQYERSLRLPVGPEWQTHAAFQAGTKPRVKVRVGEVIRPMRKPLM